MAASPASPRRTSRSTSTGVKRPVVFLTATLAWTWLFLTVAVLLGRPWTATPTVVLFVVATIGPALVASLLVWWSRGVEGVTAFWLRAVAFHRLPLRWWALIAALAAGPPLAARLVVAGTSQGLVTGEFALAFAAVGLLAGLAEEPGWRRRPVAAESAFTGDQRMDSRPEIIDQPGIDKARGRSRTPNNAHPTTQISVATGAAVSDTDDRDEVLMMLCL